MGKEIFPFFFLSFWGEEGVGKVFPTKAGKYFYRDIVDAIGFESTAVSIGFGIESKIAQSVQEKKMYSPPFGIKYLDEG